MRVLIFGATGLLGRVLPCEWTEDEVVGVGSQQADIRESSQLQALFARIRPDCTVLSAAYTDVDGCEKNPELAHDVNCTGAINVALMARQFGSRFLFISTDYVFDGTKTAPYEAEDPVSPVNIYGASKAKAEAGIRKILPDCLIVRTSWLFGAEGKCFPNTILQAAVDGRSLRVVDDQRGCPTFNRDLARAIVQLAQLGAEGTVHVTNKDACSWYEFAVGLLRGAGMENVEVEAVSSSEFPRPARRPAHSVLSSARLNSYGISMRPWRATLAEYFGDRKAAFQVADSDRRSRMNNREGK